MAAATLTLQVRSRRTWILKAILRVVNQHGLILDVVPHPWLTSMVQWGWRMVVIEVRSGGRWSRIKQKPLTLPNET